MDQKRISQDVYSELEQYIHELIAQKKELLGVLKPLTEKVDSVTNSTDFASVFTVAQIHGYEYAGENFEEELEAAKKLLKEYEGGE